MEGYDPNEGGEERDRFRNNMDKILDRVENGYRLCILGYLNGWIGDENRHNWCLWSSRRA